MGVAEPVLEAWVARHEAPGVVDELMKPLREKLRTQDVVLVKGAL